jgi:hypothetical protein
MPNDVFRIHPNLAAKIEASIRQNTGPLIRELHGNDAAEAPDEAA